MKLLIASVQSIFAAYAFMLASVWILDFGNDIQMSMVQIFAIFGGVYILLLFMFVGLPAHLVLSKFKIHAWYWYLFAGFIPGVACMYFLHPFGINISLREQLSNAIFAGVIGSVCSLTLWQKVARKNA